MFCFNQLRAFQESFTREYLYANSLHANELKLRLHANEVSYIFYIFDVTSFAHFDVYFRCLFSMFVYTLYFDVCLYVYIRTIYAQNNLKLTLKLCNEQISTSRYKFI